MVVNQTQFHWIQRIHTCTIYFFLSFRIVMDAHLLLVEICDIGSFLDTSPSVLLGTGAGQEPGLAGDQGHKEQD